MLVVLVKHKAVHREPTETRRPAIITAAIPFWDQVALNAVAPLVTAVFGLLLAGLVINLLTRALQDRRTANQLKYDLLGQITDCLLYTSPSPRDTR